MNIFEIQEEPELKRYAMAIDKYAQAPKHLTLFADALEQANSYGNAKNDTH